MSDTKRLLGALLLQDAGREGFEDEGTFCRGPYFDYDLTWNTTNPNLTQCFRDTALIGTPAAILWAFGAGWLFIRAGRQRKKDSAAGTYS